MATYQLDFINKQAKKNPEDFIIQCEQHYVNQIELVAEQLVNNHKQKPIALLCGPSSSGKTTTADRLCRSIKKRGLDVDTISMDDYYLTRDTYEVPWDEENGVYDFESPLCMDLPLLHEHLKKLTMGEQIAVPTFDFAKKERTDKVKPLSLSDDKMIVIEGIHAFNETLMGGLEQFSSGIYIALASSVDTGKNILTPDQLRFCRRAVRDAKFRSASVQATVKQWKSVRRGERIYIDPYKFFASYAIDSYLPYETLIFMDILRNELKENELKDAGLTQICEAEKLFSTIDYKNYMPEASVLHEFIG